MPILDEDTRHADSSGDGSVFVQKLLGWDAPFLRNASAWLIENCRGRGFAGAAVDLGGVTVLMPTSRSGRLLLASLTDRVSRGLVGTGDSGVELGKEGGGWGGGVIPPEVITPGVWVERLVSRAVGGDFEGVGGRAASGVVRRWAWTEAVRSATEVERAGVLGAGLPSWSFDDSWMRIASYLERMSDACAGAGYRFGDVARLAGVGVDAGDIERWESAAALQDRYVGVLSSHGWFDPALRAAKVAFERGAICGIGKIVLAGISELTGTQRRFLRRCSAGGSEVVSLICAPSDVADGFDEFGAVLAEYWRERDVPVADADVWFADGPRSQGDAVARALVHVLESNRGGETGGGWTSDDVVIGIADTAIGGSVERSVSAAGLRVRPAVGRAFVLTSPATFLDAAVSYAVNPTLESLGAIVRHPVLASHAGRLRAVGDVCARGLVPADRWAEMVDSFAERVGVGSLRLNDWRVLPDGFRGAAEFRRLRRFVHAAISELLPKRSDGFGERRMARVWADSFTCVLRRVFECAGDEAGSSEEVASRDPETEEALAGLFGAVAGLAELDAAGGEIRLSRALSLVMSAVPTSVAPLVDPRGDEIEAVGWLELLFDPAEVCVVAGMHDHSVPGSGGSVDGLLTERWRRRLGVLGGDVRAARDAYLFRALIGSRRRVVVVAGRRDSTGDRVWPSRLLFRDEPGVVVGRLEQYLLEDVALSSSSASASVGTGVVAGARGFERKVWPAAVPGSMSVSSFKQYLASPYLFYLQYVLGLRVFEPTGRELDADVFGSLVHEALRGFGRSAEASSADAEKVAASMLDALEEQARGLIGSSPTASVRMQLDMARRRLGFVAGWQAERARAGWRILHQEWSPAGGCGLEVDGEVMGLRGRIDRIDRNERTGEFSLIDYKTGRVAANPVGAHRRSSGEWVDLQLPLYRKLASSVVGGDGGVQLAYLEVPTKDPNGGDLLRVAAWTEADLADADATACDIVRAVRRGEYGELGDTKHVSGAMAALCGIWYAEADDGREVLGGGDGDDGGGE